jgi:hypothetical protein
MRTQTDKLRANSPTDPNASTVLLPEPNWPLLLCLQPTNLCYSAYSNNLERILC